MTTKNRTRKSARTYPMWLTTERVIVGGAIALTVALVLFVFLSSSRNYESRNAVIDGVQFYPAQSGQHTQDTVNYAVIPPVGGQHNPVWQNCGVYSQPVANEHAVHSLEHGAVWITYEPSRVSQDTIDRLADITRQSDHRLLSPYPGIDSPIILSAWGYQLKLDSVDDPRLMQFINKYESGPTTPEQGGLCSGGTSATLGQ